VKVRRATAHDVVPLLGSMHALAVFEGYAADFRVTADDLLVRGLAGTGPKQFIALVAEDGHGAMCGHAVLLLTPFTYDLRPTVVLKELYVDARRRRQGVAEALLDAVHAEAVAFGAGRIRWLVLPGNAPAKRLYRRWGGAPDPAWESWERRLD
jgi:GNAT superfamily N-acetyltransferase